MKCHILFSLCVVPLVGCIAHGEHDIGQNNNDLVASDGNLECRVFVNLFSVMQSEFRDLRTEIKEQQAKHEEELGAIKAKYEVEISALKAQFEDADKEIMQLKKEHKNKPETVYAQVQLLGENRLTAGVRVRFTSTIANIGGAYKTAQGYFVAPYDGLYLFTATLCMKSKTYAEFRIVQDYSILSEAFAGDSSWHACSSATAATYMQTGSKVWVQLDRVHGGVISSYEGIPSFTGVFINNLKKP